MIRYIEYTDDGEIFHIAEVHTASTVDVGQVHPSRRAAMKEAAEREVAEKEADTLQELQEHVDNGKNLHVLADGDEIPEHGRHRFDVAKGKVVRRTDKQYSAWLKAKETEGETA